MEFAHRFQREPPDDVEWVVYENELDTPPEAKIDDGRRFFDRLLGERAATTDQAHETGAP